ncbi:MAG: hypothetical protein Q8744_00700 [Sweet potato little leaf phytoplasma]|uniref:hypothetical protein n=1 Tax=Candidatus Phytoplasma australasiaticum TaxID=2754999 RepID=UPI002712DFD0|nr:hypothetical protein [Sweet potato little leaf phytoplasma]MDO7986955.1 hypothetical protein [Sweet potato little leaf phytoplasma]MDO8008552.1 hypothetical protein [Sweet potato little leaf phytoplasma]MDV3140782.1 hypothetical protein [Sweet potato little leaf phytoplasma]MDV3144100.1 hypothetical protein [Sweet potato little leaf phytoplasma]MDV3156707.1 hypothetical protein [Sweet potato little leaf phytoplasma]
MSLKNIKILSVIVLFMIIGAMAFIFSNHSESSFMPFNSKENLTSGTILPEDPKLKINNDSLILPEENDDDLKYQFSSISDNNVNFPELKDEEIASILSRKSSLLSDVNSTNEMQSNIDEIESKTKSNFKFSSLFKPFRNIKKNLKKLKKINSANTLVNHNVDLEPEYATIQQNNTLENHKNRSAVEFCKLIESPGVIAYNNK